MAERTLHPQWRDENEASRYPFADSATLASTTGLELGADTFLDAQLYPIGNAAGLYLTTVVVDTSDVTLYIGTTANSQLCSVTFDGLNPPSLLALTDAYGRPAGVLISEPLRLSIFRSWFRGTHSFAIDASPFVASVSVPTPEIGVRGIITEDGDVLTGDIWIVGEDGVIITEDTDDHDGCRVIRVDIVGDPLFLRKLCQDQVSGDVPLFVAKPFLQTINGLPPDAYGNFLMTAGGNDTEDTILRIYPTTEGLQFEAVGQRSGDL
jgi:hypothetical protein